MYIYINSLYKQTFNNPLNPITYETNCINPTD